MLQPALIIGTSISGWRVNWSGYARLSLSVKLSEILAETIKELGLSSLKPKQEEAIRAFVSGKDVFVSLPTGYGKSLIYGILPLIYNKLRG